MHDAPTCLLTNTPAQFARARDNVNKLPSPAEAFVNAFLSRAFIGVHSTQWLVDVSPAFEIRLLPLTVAEFDGKDWQKDQAGARKQSQLVVRARSHADSRGQHGPCVSFVSFRWTSPDDQLFQSAAQKHR
jgi:hypothetical protein